MRLPYLALIGFVIASLVVTTTGYAQEEDEQEDDSVPSVTKALNNVAGISGTVILLEERSDEPPRHTARRALKNALPTLNPNERRIAIALVTGKSGVIYARCQGDGIDATLEPTLTRALTAAVNEKIANPSEAIRHVLKERGIIPPDVISGASVQEKDEAASPETVGELKTITFSATIPPSPPAAPTIHQPIASWRYGYLGTSTMVLGTLACLTLLAVRLSRSVRGTTHSKLAEPPPPPPLPQPLPSDEELLVRHGFDDVWTTDGKIDAVKYEKQFVNKLFWASMELDIIRGLLAVAAYKYQGVWRDIKPSFDEATRLLGKTIGKRHCDVARNRAGIPDRERVLRVCRGLELLANPLQVVMMTCKNEILRRLEAREVLYAIADEQSRYRRTAPLLPDEKKTAVREGLHQYEILEAQMLRGKSIPSWEEFYRKVQALQEELEKLCKPEPDTESGRLDAFLIQPAGPRNILAEPSPLDPEGQLTLRPV